MAKFIDSLFLRKGRPFTIWEAMVGKGVPRFVASQPGSLLTSSLISKKNYNSSSFSEAKWLKGSTKI
jgi:hypothetical protein